MRILVIGATGRHGASLIDSLLDGGRHTVRAMTRRPESAAAAALRDRHVEVVLGDLDDRPSLRAALANCSGVFVLLGCGPDVAVDRRRGLNLINAVAGSEIDYFVFGIPAADLVCRDLEPYARRLELPATFIRLQSEGESAALAGLVAPMFDDPAAFVGRTVVS
jgi:uncharacterized protein YbjT (DUF2867 family)